MKKWTAEEIELLKNKYWQSKPEELCDIFNRDWTSIKNKAFRENIKRDKSFAFRYSNDKRIINEDFFKNWSHEMAYILGFITADGNIFENRLGIILHIKDVELLEKVAKKLGENISVSKYEKTCRIAIRCDEWVKDLNYLGVFSNKTFSIKPPNVPKEYINSYIRGIIDGDGCINIRNRKVKNGIRVSIRGNEFVVEWLKNIINEIVDSKANYSYSNTKNGVSYCLQYSYNKALNLLKWIYYDGCLKMDRKYKIYTDYLEYLNKVNN